jgi:uncharacterized membrane protein YjjP (DUF1212 family)|tara:strand:- start:57 stop:485 length:429 start_codon:yes stop_codon:yes gene_type:complete
MYKVTGYFRDNKVTRSFTDLYDAIDFRDIVDAHYPLNVTFEKVIDMREFIYDSWNGIMDAERNPLKHIPDTNVRHMVMQVLAWMWCITFAMLIGSWTVFAISAVAHVFLIAAIVITVATFETAKRKPQFFGGFGRGAGGEHE